MMAELIDFGVSTQFEDQQSCTGDKGLQYCEEFLDIGLFHKFFREKCKTQTNCHFSNLFEIQKYRTDPVKFEICAQKQSRIFIQYKCEQDVIKVNIKQKDSLLLAVLELVCISLFVFTLYFNYLKTKKMDDIYTKYMIMVNDYALYLRIGAK